MATRTHAVAVHRRHDPELTQTLQQIVEVTKPFIYCGLCSMKLPPAGFRGRQEVFVGALLLDRPVPHSLRIPRSVVSLAFLSFSSLTLTTLARLI